MKEMSLNEKQISITKEMGIELYDFIRTHLDVINDTPYVEDFMMELEEMFINMEE